MSEDFKRYKETESRVHESLYGNLSLLSAFYPTTLEFTTLFRKDMFVKNNRAAFHEVIHYLLEILDPVETKNIFPSWPLIDIKEDPKFRNELLAYVNSLNTFYPSADIPKCQASTLISPGGFTFAFFMLKISQLVIFEHLSRIDQNPLYPMKANHKMVQVIKTQEENLKSETKRIDSKAQEFIQEFNKSLMSNKDTGLEITKQLEMLNQEICSKKNQLENDKAEFNKKFPMYPPLASLENEIMQLKSQIDKLVTLSETFQSNENLLKWLSSSNVSLEYNEENFVVPEDFSFIITSKKELDLCQYFQALLVLLEKKAIQLQRPINLEAMKITREEIQSQIKKNVDTFKQFKLEGERMNKVLDYLSASHTL